MRLARWYVIAAFALASGLILGLTMDSPAQQSDQSSSLRTMQSLMRSLASVFPLSLHQEDYRHPANRRTISLALEVLRENAEALSSHGQDDNPSFSFLRRSLARDTEAAAETYEEGRYEVSRIFLHQLTENCFACHTRLPGPANKTFGKQFIDDMEIEPMSLDNRARLQVITRRFDDALTTYEEMLQLPVWEEPLLGFDGAFENYLKVSMRVRKDVTHPIPVLQQFSERLDLPRYMTQPVKEWIESMKELRNQSVPDDTLAYARTLIRDGQVRKMFPGDRQGMVHFVAASSMLNQYVQSNNEDKTALAEAFFLLAVAESHISTTAWVSETEFFLENAIRLAPKAPFSVRAYAILEENVLMQHGALPDIPPEVLEYLDELRDLIEG